jgi:hypothetical protein
MNSDTALPYNDCEDSIFSVIAVNLLYSDYI